MRYGKRSFWLVLGLVMGTAPANAQDMVALAQRGPRFLVNAPSGPIPADIDRTPVLRRRISLELRDVKLGEALNAITRASGLRLGFSRDVVPVDRTVRLVAEDITVAGALSTVLFDTGVDVLFSDGQAALVRRAGLQRRPRAPVSGRVMAQATEAPIVGANVALSLSDSDSTLRTTTSDSGTFRFVDVPSGEHVITVRYIGFKALTKKIVVEDTPVSVDFALESQAVKLNELVTTATGPQRRRDIGNAITTINADSVLQTAPIRNLTDLLDDRVPGLTVQHTSGAPGDPARLRLRGIGSVLRGNDPVVIVDGVRIYSAQSEARSGNLTNLAPSLTGGNFETSFNANNIPAPSPLDQIDPNTIDKVEIFKGPSAATLYGPDAANGVIVITTKKGRPGPTQWNARITHDRTGIPGQWPQGYFRWGRSPSFGGADRICFLVDFNCQQDSLVRYQILNDPALTMLGQGHTTAMSLTASGGTQALVYSLTGTYRDDLGLLQLPTFEVERFAEKFNRQSPDWMQRPHRLETWSVSSNVKATLSPTADVTLTASLTRTEQQRSNLENRITSMAGAYLDKTSGIYYFPVINMLNPANGRTDSILANYYTKTIASSIKFTTGLNAAWRPVPWFDLRGRTGIDIIPRDDERFLPAGLFSATDSGALIRATGRSLVSSFDLQGTLYKPLKWGFVFQTSVGANMMTRRTDDLISLASGLRPGTSSIAGASFITATEARVNTSSYGWYIEPRVTGRRLSLSTGIRLDGGSSHGTRFSSTGGSILGLPKLNGSWVISEEPWFPFMGLFSSLRLRGGYGQAQVQPGATDRLRLYAGHPDENLVLTTLGNSKLRPERSVELEGGFDADLLDNRVSVEFTAFRKTQVDALMRVQLPISVNGGGAVIRNIGNVRNQGIEVELRATPLRSSMLTWSAALQYSRTANTLVKLGTGVDPDPVNGIVAGYPVGSRWSYPILGYTDQDANGIISRDEVQLGDTLVFLGRLYPAYTTSLHNNLALFGGAVLVTAGFNYESGATQVNETVQGPGSAQSTLIRASSDPSAPLGEQAAFAVIDSTAYGMTQDISTLRFSSFSINYRAPARIAQLIRASNVMIGITGQNLGLHSTYSGKDPDVNTWSASERIMDTGQLPQPRIWQLAISLTY